jgi:hypothetical protein
MYANRKMISVETVPRMGRGDKGERNFVNVTVDA